MKIDKDYFLMHNYGANIIPYYIQPKQIKLEKKPRKIEPISQLEKGNLIDLKV